MVFEAYRPGITNNQAPRRFD